MHGIRSKPLYHVHRLGLGPAGNNEKRASGHWSFSFSIQLAVSGAPHFLFHGGPVCFEWIEWRLVPPSHARSSLSHFANRTAVPWKLKSFRSTSTARDMLTYMLLLQFLQVLPYETESALGTQSIISRRESCDSLNRSIPRD